MVVINSDCMFEMSTGYFYAHLEPFVEQQYCCINWALKRVIPDLIHNVLHLRNVGQSWFVTLSS